MAVVGVIASCDTKYHEVQFVQKKIKMSGNSPLILDVSTGPHIPMRADVSREEILDTVWGRDYFGELKIVDVNIRRLRLKIEDNVQNPVYITTVWGYGYKWGF